MEFYPHARENAGAGNGACYPGRGVCWDIWAAPVDVHGRELAAEEECVEDLVGPAEGDELSCKIDRRAEADDVNSLEGAPFCYCCLLLSRVVVIHGLEPFDREAS